MDDIKAWLQNQERDYLQGVTLLEKHHKNKMLVRHFRGSNSTFNAKKLEYELKKLSGIPLTVLFTQAGSNSQQIEATPEKTIRQEKEIPEAIKKAKGELYRLFTDISIAHRMLYELGESNSEDIVKQRKELLEKRLPLIQRYEQLYLLKEQYFATGTLPDALPLLLEEQAKSIPEAEESSGNSSSCGLHLLSGVELMKKKQATVVAINKIQNRLQYQSLTKAEQPNPMPPSPQREKLEAKLATLKEELTKILQLIEEKQ